jgi:hypothetical protein
MRRASLLLAVLVAGGCGGDDEAVTETVTVTTATTVTVTETTTVTGPATTTAPAPSGWNGLSFPLPEDGSLPVDEFNAYAESVDAPWERDLAGVTNTYLGENLTDASSRSFQATTAGEGGTSANVSLLLDGLFDDSVRSRRFDLTLSRRPDGTWRIDTAQWAQRCQEGRGHQDFSPELCD